MESTRRRGKMRGEVREFTQAILFSSSFPQTLGFCKREGKEKAWVNKSQR